VHPQLLERPAAIGGIIEIDEQKRHRSVSSRRIAPGPTRPRPRAGHAARHHAHRTHCVRKKEYGQAASGARIGRASIPSG
jgi:hypothetical protein